MHKAVLGTQNRIKMLFFLTMPQSMRKKAGGIKRTVQNKSPEMKAVCAHKTSVLCIHKIQTKMGRPRWKDQMIPKHMLWITSISLDAEQP